MNDLLQYTDYLISDAIFQLWVIAFIAGLSILGLTYCLCFSIYTVAKLGWEKISGARK